VNPSREGVYSEVPFLEAARDGSPQSIRGVDKDDLGRPAANNAIPCPTLRRKGKSERKC
jgi:hypothetical protein